MADLLFKSLDEAGFSTLRSWFNDPELQRRFEYPTRIWFNYVCNEPKVYAWLIQEDTLPVGQLQLDIETDQIGYLGFYVKPELRNQGFGQRILRTFLAKSVVSSLKRIVATAEADNLASHYRLKAVGFIQDESKPDEDGFLRFVYTMGETAVSP